MNTRTRNLQYRAFIVLFLMGFVIFMRLAMPVLGQSSGDQDDQGEDCDSVQVTPEATEEDDVEETPEATEVDDVEETPEATEVDDVEATPEATEVEDDQGENEGNCCTGSAPAGWTTYTVQAGDTLSGIAAASGTDADTLAEANCLEDEDNIVVGQVLFVPTTPIFGQTSGSSGGDENVSDDQGEDNQGDDDDQGEDEDGGGGEDNGESSGSGEGAAIITFYIG